MGTTCRPLFSGPPSVGPLKRDPTGSYRARPHPRRRQHSNPSGDRYVAVHPGSARQSGRSSRATHPAGTCTPMGYAVPAFDLEHSHEERTFSRRPRARTRAPARHQARHDRADRPDASRDRQRRHDEHPRRDTRRHEDLPDHGALPPPGGRQAEDPVCLLRAHAHRAGQRCSTATSTPGCTTSPNCAWCARWTARRAPSCRTAIAGSTTTTCAITCCRCCSSCPTRRFESTELTATRLYLKVVTPRVQHRDPAGRHRPGRCRDQQLRGRPGNALGSAAALPAGLQERPDRRRPRDAQDARGRA